MSTTTVFGRGRRQSNRSDEEKHKPRDILPAKPMGGNVIALYTHRRTIALSRPVVAVAVRIRLLFIIIIASAAARRDL